MRSLERMLTDALREEAGSRDVDVARLWSETRNRLDHEPRVRRGRRPAILAAAAAAAVVVGAAGLTWLSGPDRVAPSGPADGPVRGESSIADGFTCPEQVVHDWTRPSSVVDKRFVATLRNGLEFQARGYDVPAYELEVAGDRAFASFGNTDGTLALRSEFHRQDGEWVRFRSEVCTGEDGSVAVPVEDPLALRNHLGDAPLPPDMSGRDPVLLDHRAYYTHVGVVEPRSLYAGACGKALCLQGVYAGAHESISVRIPSGATPRDVSWVFLPIGSPDWRTQPYGMWALYDRDGEVEDVTFSRGNMVFRAEQMTSDSWPGTLHLVVAPFEEVTGIAVHPPRSAPDGGLSTSYEPRDLRGYRPDLHD